MTEMTQDDATTKEMVEGLAKLREPFPEDKIEKLPKPKWRGAWDGKPGGHCNECHGYHVLEDCIHLDYVGHAQTTNRLLEADPFWSWEPMAYTEQGTPLFNDGGLWINLTVCGVTRIGYGDGKTVKEVIGDAIRNAAMRFGVALNLWAKIDLHAERNPGDGETPQRREVVQGRSRNRAQAARDTDMEPGAGPAQGRQNSDQHVPPEATRAPNQDALDTLGEVCDENGFPRQGMRQQYLNWAAKTGRPEGDLLLAPPKDISDFILHLLESMEPPEDSGDAAADGEADGDSTAQQSDIRADPASSDGAGGATARGESAAGDPAVEAGGVHRGGSAVASGAPVIDPETGEVDTSDVEKGEGDLF